MWLLNLHLDFYYWYSVSMPLKWILRSEIWIEYVCLYLYGLNDSQEMIKTTGDWAYLQNGMTLDKICLQNIIV